MLKWIVLTALLCNVVNVKTNDLILVDPDPDGDEAEVSVQQDEKVYDIFEATREWQEIKPNQAIPRGLHVRINMETGKKEAKLYDPDQQDSQNSEKEKQLEHEKLKEALKNIKNDMKEKSNEEDKKNKFRSIEEIRTEFAAVDTKMETEFDIVSRLVQEFVTLNGNSDKVQGDDESLSVMSDVLVNLEYYVHKYDNAIDFLTLEGIDRVLRPSLNSSSLQIQQNAAFIIGSAAQSNPKVQIAFLEAGFIHELARKISDSPSVEVGSKCVYALAAILRNFPEAQNLFFRSGGLEVLKQVFRDTQDSQDRDQTKDKIRIKILTLIQDLWDERLNLDVASPDAEARKLQYAKSDLNNLFETSGWCEVYQFPLLTTVIGQPDHDLDHDRIEKVVTAMTAVQPLCGHQFQTNVKLRQRLEVISRMYKDMVVTSQEEGEDEYFSDLVDKLDQILTVYESDHSVKSEL